VRRGTMTGRSLSYLPHMKNGIKGILWVQMDDEYE
jgi:hypothetical protein